MGRTQILYLAIEIAAIQTRTRDSTELRRTSCAGSNPRKTLSPRRRTKVCVAAISNRQGLMFAFAQTPTVKQGLASIR
mgnify:CR=1 FL=1